jgi:hypothetical protein
MSAKLNELEEALKSQDDGIKNISFLTMDGSTIPEQELLSALNDVPFQFYINDAKDFKYNLNLNQNITIQEG